MIVSFRLSLCHQAAKLLLILRDGPTRKDSTVNSKKKHQNLLYWGLVPVFDHKYENGG